MPAIVFVSGAGRKYHFDQQCKAFQTAQELSDLDCGCDTYCTHRLPRMHPLIRMSSTKAAIDGKLPCLTCVPPHLRELDASDSFGHEPTTGISLFGLAETVCQRCTEWGVWYGSADDLRPVHILWPCTSAVVLGLVPPRCPHCKGDGGDPNELGDWIPEVGRHNPYTVPPCPKCHGTGHATP
ncbi:hypothetical protein [Streptomyces sp. NPDC058295]|uniref:hypothetical protein n=1 Tax=Streptomyces sp. NPDC058295 TaxID=3346431 RepID=UPI0036F0CBB7